MKRRLAKIAPLSVHRATAGECRERKRERTDLERYIESGRSRGYFERIGALQEKKVSRWTQLRNQVLMERSCICDRCHKFTFRDRLKLRRKEDAAWEDMPRSENFDLICTACEIAEALVQQDIGNLWDVPKEPIPPTENTDCPFDLV